MQSVTVGAQGQLTVTAAEQLQHQQQQQQQQQQQHSAVGEREREYELQDLRAEQGLVQGMDALPVQVSVGAGLWV